MSESFPVSPPAIAVVIATYGRPTAIARAVASVRRSRLGAFQLCIVDQNETPSAPTVSADAAEDVRVQIVAGRSKSLSSARNLGVSLTDAPIIAFTDDDCEVDPGWLDAMVSAFASDPSVGVVFGTLRAATYDRTRGLIPAYEVPVSATARTIAEKSHIEGIGGCMAVRRATFQTLHGFDERFGAGTRVCAAEDTDFAMRALAAGASVHETPLAVVTHHGYRDWGEGKRLIAGYMIGLGAAYAKIVRLCGVRAMKPVAALAWRWIAREPVVDLNQHPPRLSRLTSFLRGAWIGLRTPLDRKSGHFTG